MKTRTKMISMTLTVAATTVLWIQPAESQIVTATPTNSLLTISDTASSTLLGTHFMVDLANPTGMNTIFTVNNMGATTFVSFGGGPFNPNTNGATAVLAHVSIWSDLGVPVFNFNIYLTGYDVERIDMRKVLNGMLPQTASAGQDPQDKISPKGPLSQDINFASCTTPMNFMNTSVSSYPVLPPGPLSAAQISNMQASLTGNPSAANAGQCAGTNRGDNIARGYITIDTVNSCSAQFPGDAGYISNTLTDQSFQLTGEVFYSDQLHGIGMGDTMVHIHSSYNDPQVTTAGNYTFYGRYDGFNASDHRQPLPTNFGARFLNGNFTGAPVGPPSSPAWGVPPASPPAGSTSLIVWRDPKVPEPYFTCGSTPFPYPLAQEGITAFDEQEHPQGMITGPPNNPVFTQTVFGPGFPIATQIVKVGSAALPVSFPSGWIYLDLNHSNAPGPASDTAEAQAWVQVIEQNGPQIITLLHRAQATDSGTRPVHSAPH